MADSRTDVARVVQAFADCWNRHDMKAFGRLFAPDAEFVNVVGLWWKGRDEIQQAHEATHSTLFSNSRLSVAEVFVRFPAEGVAIARSRWQLQGHVSPAGVALPVRQGLLVNVMALGPAGWWIIDSQNTDIVEGEPSRPQ